MNTIQLKNEQYFKSQKKNIPLKHKHLKKTLTILHVRQGHNTTAVILQEASRY